MREDAHLHLTFRFRSPTDLQRGAFFGRQLRHRVIAANSADMALRNLDTSRRSRVGGEDVDDIAAHRDLARFVHPVVDQIADRLHL